MIPRAIAANGAMKMNPQPGLLAAEPALLLPSGVTVRLLCDGMAEDDPPPKLGTALGVYAGVGDDVTGAGAVVTGPGALTDDVWDE